MFIGCVQARNQKLSTRGEGDIFLTGEGGKTFRLLLKLIQGFSSDSCSLD